MIATYYDTDDNKDIYTDDNPYCKIRIVFTDDKDTFVYYSDDMNCKAYINRIIDVNKKPHMFFISNMEEIESDEQYKYYDDNIQNLANYQALKPYEKIEGNLNK